MRLYCLATPSHEVLKREWLLKTLRDDYEVIAHHYDLAEAGAYKDDIFLEAVRAKVDVILRAIRENWGQAFVWSDVDVQFFRPTKPVLSRLIEDKDMVIQRNSPDGTMCTGFFMARANERTLAIWTEVKQFMLTAHEGDQEAFNHLLTDRSKGCSKWLFRWLQWAEHFPRVRRSKMKVWLKRRPIPPRFNGHDLRITLLPDSFLGGGTLTGRPWDRNRPFPIPDDIVMHHANWTSGLEHKIAQLEYVRSRVSLRI